MNIKELDATIKTLNGADIMLSPKQPLTYRNALVSSCETFQSDSPGSGETLRVYDLGLKIINAKDKLSFSDDEISLLKKIVENNRAFMAVIVGRLLEFINKSN